MRIEKDYEEFVELLNKHEVKYLVTVILWIFLFTLIKYSSNPLNMPNQSR